MTREERKELWNKIIDDNIMEIRISDDIKDLFNPEDNRGYVYLKIKDMLHFNNVTLDVLDRVAVDIQYFNESDEMWNLEILVIHPDAMHYINDTQIVVYKNGSWLV